MSYTVFARKWRPQTFDEVIGQAHITTTLKNAIKLDRVAHAYLFSGPRGVGKTSVARILAKALNCQTGPTETPCNKCTNCLEITSGSSMDVIEIDGASNRRIDDVREIGENVRFTPTNSRFKIYIIDEVHMLTKEAFNALLKTLEEPPAHVKFIFATTEPEKIIETIVSRCQKFEFTRIEVNEIVANLINILNKENIKIEENILFNIARLAEGGMRDALSLLDQIISYCDNDIKTQDVESILGIIGFDAIAEFTKNILQGNTIECLNFIDFVTKQGKDINNFLTSLIQYIRELLIIKIVGDGLFRPGTGNNLELSNLSAEEIKTATEITTAITLEKLTYIINILLELDTKIKGHNNPRIPFEVGIIKLTHLEDLKSLKAILEYLKSDAGRQRMEDGGQKEATPLRRVRIIQDQAEENPIAQQKQPDSHQTEQKTEQTPNTNSTPHTPLAPTNITSTWQTLITNVKHITLPLSLTLSKGTPTTLEDGQLTISFSSKDKFHKENVEKEQNKTIIQDALTHILGKQATINFILQQSEQPDTPKQQQTAPKKTLTNRELVEKPVVKKTLSVFDGKVVDIINL